MDINNIKHDPDFLKKEARRLPLSVVARKYCIEITELRKMLGLTAIDSTKKHEQNKNLSPRLKTVLEVEGFVKRYNKKNNTDYIPLFR